MTNKRKTQSTTAAILAGALFLVVSGCTHSIHMVYASDFSPYAPYSQGKIIQATGKQVTFMGFVSSTDYVDRAMKKLAGQCTGGQIEGITTQYSTSHGFFSWTNKILVQGLCLKG